MATFDELAVSPEEMAQAAEAVSTPSDADIEAAVTDTTTPEELEATVDVPESAFWDENVAADSDDIAEPEPDLEVPHSDGETLTYKVNGREQTVSLEEAKKLLSHVGGAKKAFSDKAKMRRQLDKAKAEREELLPYKEAMDKLEKYKDDHDELVRVLTGKSLDDLAQQKAERLRVYEAATPEERQLLDYEARMQALEAKQAREIAELERKLQEAEAREYAAEEKQLYGKLEREYHKYELPAADPAVKNRLGKMLWRNAIADLKEFDEAGYEINEKVIRKAFKDNYSALNNLYGEEVERGMQQKTTAKRIAAKEKAQLASTRNYTPTIDKDLVGLNPTDLFKKLTGRS